MSTCDNCGSLLSPEEEAAITQMEEAAGGYLGDWLCNECADALLDCDD